MLFNNIEERTIILKGLNGKKHVEKLNDMRKRGWIDISVNFNTDQMVTEYQLKRPIHS